MPNASEEAPDRPFHNESAGSVCNVATPDGSVNSTPPPAEFSSDPSGGLPESAAPHPAVRGDQPPAEGASCSCGPSAPSEAEAVRTPQREADGTARSGGALDTLGKPRQSPSDEAKEAAREEARETLEKRARMKWVGSALVDELADLDSEVPYERAYSCSSVIRQENGTLTSTYCECRWCLVCNRIRMGTQINDYLPIFRLWEKEKGVFFVTLTTPNVKGQNLRSHVKEMKRHLRNSRRQIRRTRGLDYRALEKYEVTFNEDENTFNPHLHVAVRGKEQALALREEHLNRWPEASKGAQDVRRWDGSVGGMKELLKYVTKMIHPDRGERPPVEALDTIFRQLKNLQLTSPVGFDKKEERERAIRTVEGAETDAERTARPELDEQEEDPFEDLEAVIMAFSDPTEKRLWEWDGRDWVDKETGECLTGWEPSDEDRSLVDSPEGPP